MTDEQYLEGWVRRGVWLVGGFVLLSLALGCGFVATRLIAGETRAALAGSAIMLSCCTLGLIAWAGLRLAKLVMMNTTALERLRYRLDLLEARADLAADERAGEPALALAEDHANGPAPPTKTAGPTVRDIEAVTSAVEMRPEPAPAARSNGATGDPEIALCDAIERGDLVECRALLERSAGRVTAGRLAQLQGQVDALVARRAQSLRASFRQMMSDGRLTDALTTGERILREVPDRRIASDFQTLRPLLQRRIDETAEAAQSSHI